MYLFRTRTESPTDRIYIFLVKKVLINILKLLTYTVAISVSIVTILDVVDNASRNVHANIATWIPN